MTVCEKISYTTEQDARNAVSGLQKSKRGKNISSKQPVSFYRCDDCGHWHLTIHRTGKKKKQKGLVHTHTKTMKTKKGPKNTDFRLKIKDFTGH